MSSLDTTVVVVGVTTLERHTKMTAAHPVLTIYEWSDAILESGFSIHLPHGYGAPKGPASVCCLRVDKKGARGRGIRMTVGGVGRQVKQCKE